MTLVADLLVTAAGFGLFYLGAIGLTAIVLALKAGARRDDVAERQTGRSVSRFTIPVSVIVPLGRAGELDTVLQSLSRLTYPELEIIVIISGAEGAAFDAAAAAWQLEAKEFFYRQSIATGEVRRLYRSTHAPRVMVVDKAGSSRADAINCGINIARFRYVAVIDEGIDFEPDALLRLMAAPLRDPGSVLAATAHVERLGRFERLAAARSLMDSRLFWRYRSRAFGTAGLIYAWRRDALLDAKGFSTSAFDADADMIRRAVIAASAQGAPARIHRSADIFGTVAPRRLGEILAETGRHQLDAPAQLSLLSPTGIAAFGAKAVIWQLAGSIVTPLAEFSVAAGTAAALFTGAMTWGTALAAVALLSFGRASVTAAALLMRGVSPGAPDERSLVTLLLAGPFESVTYRPLMAAASLFGRRL